jgi:hypothetical protein
MKYITKGFSFLITGFLFLITGLFFIFIIGLFAAIPAIIVWACWSVLVPELFPYAVESGYITGSPSLLSVFCAIWAIVVISNLIRKRNVTNVYR